MYFNLLLFKTKKKITWYRHQNYSILSKRFALNSILRHEVSFQQLFDLCNQFSVKTDPSHCFVPLIKHTNTRNSNYMFRNKPQFRSKLDSWVSIKKVGHRINSKRLEWGACIIWPPSLPGKTGSIELECGFLKSNEGSS